MRRICEFAHMHMYKIQGDFDIDREFQYVEISRFVLSKKKECHQWKLWMESDVYPNAKSSIPFLEISI